MSSAEFIRCKCGAEWRHTINMLDGEPVWCRPKAKRGECEHRKEDARALVDGKWVAVVVAPESDTTEVAS